MKSVIDPNPALRSAVEWRQALDDLVGSLSAAAGIELQPTSWLVEDDRARYASACNCVIIRGAVNTHLELDVRGVVCVTVNFGEAAWASSDLLLFAAGRRIRGPDRADFVHFSYTDAGWFNHGWVTDEYGEWESHTTDECWETASPPAS